MIHVKEGFSGSRSIVLPPYLLQKLGNDPLLSALHITDIGYYPAAHFHFVERRQGIGQYVLIYCANGAGSYTVGNYTYDIHTNQYFILPPDTPHSYSADQQNPWTIYWIHFGGTLAPHYVHQGLEPKDVKADWGSRITHRITLFEEILQTLHRGLKLENLHYASSLFHYYLGTLMFERQYQDQSAANEAPDEDIAIQAAVHYMKENLETRISLSEVASYVGYSVSHFSHLFQSRMGESPVAYFNQLKIESAAHLLATTKMRVNQICYKVGLEDPFYFSRLFTKIKGVSPREYRNNHQLPE